MWPLISTRSAVGDALGGWPPPVLDPAGPYANPLATLSWVLFGGAGLVFLVVLAALWIALFGTAARKEKLGGTRAIWIGGVAFPVVVLSVLLVWGLSMTGSLTAPIRGDEMRVKVTGEMWWWRIAYLGADGGAVLHDANELHIPVGRPVVLELESADVIHNFWVPRLSGKLDMIPGRTNIMRIQADAPGVFGGQCAEYCGGPHALMGFVVVAHHSEDFARLMTARRANIRPPAPAHPDLARGAQLFGSAGCAACHRVAGTGANGAAGPDLSYVGSRQTLGAGILPNNRGTLMGWIGNSQAIKPGNRMPPYSMLSSDDLRALAVYLEAQR
ncbi:cytochrome c oxidase subunit II [Sphingomonas parva]|uniref:Cytochrome aa3 subunit 2 n=1 Tax=Sphingomonas parva TaxID=2555898 RepID=A0A4Y8ZM77_9SPHN|nr:cytochrome c oxidase subunit II [Sphingomonas parva]TFI57054.1 cytochrome c oxidase subunit II [Sphingomonas parva]